MNKLLISLLSLVLTLAPAAAQWQTANHSTPIGQGPGVTGFRFAAPGTAGNVLTSNGPAADPTFQTPAPPTPSLVTTALGGTGVSNATNSAGDLLVSNGANGSFVHTAVNALCSLAPSACSALFGYTNLAWYGPKCDGVAIQSGGGLVMTAGSPNLSYSAGTFTSADVGKSISVPGAGTGGTYLFSTIASVTNATNVVLAANAITTIGGPPTFALPFTYGTDDTLTIQAAMEAVPNGGVLDIPAGTGGATSGGSGCLIKQQGTHSYALLQDHPFSIRGHGHLSNLMTDPSIPSTVDDILVNVGSFDWSGTTWDGFNIGDYPTYLPPTLLMYTRHGARGLALVDSPSVEFANITVSNMSIGESGNNYSLYLGNPSGGQSQFNLVFHNKIWGGIKFDAVADSNRVVFNVLQGASSFGGLFSFVAGAGKFEFSNNNATWAGGFLLQGSTKPAIINNYFEELFATTEVNNAMVDFNGGTQTIIMPTFTGNIVNPIVSTTVTPVRFANVTVPNFGDNLISTQTARTGVISVIGLSCIAPNSWGSSSPHFSTSIANSYAGC